MTGSQRRPRRTLDAEMLVRLKDPNVLFAHRNKKGWTQREVAKAVGCSQAMIHLLESGKVPGAKRPLATALCELYGVEKLEDLFEDPLAPFVRAMSSGAATANSGRAAS